MDTIDKWKIRDGHDRQVEIRDGHDRQVENQRWTRRTSGKSEMDTTDKWEMRDGHDRLMGNRKFDKNLILKNHPKKSYPNYSTSSDIIFFFLVYFKYKEKGKL